MRQGDLLQIIYNMEAGQAIILTREDMLNCADGMLRSAWDGPPRDSDIADFIKTTEENWGVSYQENYCRYPQTWTMIKRSTQ